MQIPEADYVSEALALPFSWSTVCISHSAIAIYYIIFPFRKPHEDPHVCECVGSVNDNEIHHGSALLSQPIFITTALNGIIHYVLPQLRHAQLYLCPGVGWDPSVFITRFPNPLRESIGNLTQQTSPVVV